MELNKREHFISSSQQADLYNEVNEVADTITKRKDKVRQYPEKAGKVYYLARKKTVTLKQYTSLSPAKEELENKGVTECNLILRNTVSDISIPFSELYDYIDQRTNMLDVDSKGYERVLTFIQSNDLELHEDDADIILTLLEDFTQDLWEITCEGVYFEKIPNEELGTCNLFLTSTEAFDYWSKHQIILDDSENMEVACEEPKSENLHKLLKVLDLGNLGLSVENP